MRHPEPQVPHRVDLAHVRDRDGVGDQPYGARTVGTGCGCHPFGDVRHRGPVLQPPLAAVEPPSGDGPQEPGRIQHIRDLMLHRVGVPHSVGEDSWDAEVVGEREGVCGEADRAWAGAGTTPANDLQSQPAADGLLPWGEKPLGDVRTAGGECPQRLRRRAEQHRQTFIGVLGEHLPRRRRRCARGEGLGVRGGHHPAQPRPPARVPGQERRPERCLRYVRTAAHRGAVADLGLGRMRGDAQIDTEQWLHSGGRGSFREADRAGDHVAVGQRHRSNPSHGGAGDEVTRMRGTVAG